MISDGHCGIILSNHPPHLPIMTLYAGVHPCPVLQDIGDV